MTSSRTFFWDHIPYEGSLAAALFDWRELDPVHALVRRDPILHRLLQAVRQPQHQLAVGG